MFIAVFLKGLISSSVTALGVKCDALEWIRLQEKCKKRKRPTPDEMSPKGEPQNPKE
jgi:hypothetical protein